MAVAIMARLILLFVFIETQIGFSICEEINKLSEEVKNIANKSRLS